VYTKDCVIIVVIYTAVNTMKKAADIFFAEF